MSTTPKPIVIGSVQSTPGSIRYGTFDALTLPTGGMETFPIIIAQGKIDGPTLWVTASIHGDEYTGIQVIHELLTDSLTSQLHGTLVAVPTLNPAGLRIGDRTPYYARKLDPNRLFPTPSRRGSSSDVLEVLPPLELAYRRLFEHIKATANYLIDLHNYSLGAIPFAFCDPIYYTEDREKAGAQKLLETTRQMLNAFGHTVVNEFVSVEYLKKGLHRSVSGAAVLVGRIPAFTAELGGYLTVDSAIVKAAVSGIRNVMRWAKMLTDAPEPIQGITVLQPGYAIRRAQHPHVSQAGIVQFLVEAGDFVQAGQPVGRLVDIYGRPVGPENGLIRTHYAGFVLGKIQGAAFYQNDPIMNLAIRDDSTMVLPYPS